MGPVFPPISPFTLRSVTSRDCHAKCISGLKNLEFRGVHFSFFLQSLAQCFIPVLAAAFVSRGLCDQRIATARCRYAPTRQRHATPRPTSRSLVSFLLRHRKCQGCRLRALQPALPCPSPVLLQPSGSGV